MFREFQKLVIKCMIVFQGWLNFDPVKEILEIRWHIYILMRKGIILRKILVTMKSFAPPFSTMEENSTCSRCNYWFITYSIRIGNLDWYKWGRCKNKPKAIDCLCCREVDARLVASAKIPRHKVSISPFSFYWYPHNY